MRTDRNLVAEPRERRRRSSDRNAEEPVGGAKFGPANVAKCGTINHITIHFPDHEGAANPGVAVAALTKAQSKLPPTPGSSLDGNWVPQNPTQ